MKIFRVLFIIMVVVAMSLVLVWERNHITKSGYRISALQKQKINLLEDNKILELKICKVLSDDGLCQLINSLDLQFVRKMEEQDKPANLNEVKETSLFTKANAVDLPEVIREF